MIQRIQSIYLAIAALLCVAYLFVPSIEVNDVISTAQSYMPLMILTIISAVISFADIFLFSNRPLQMNIGRLNLLLIVGLIGYAIFTEFSDGDFQPAVGAFIPLGFLLLNLLAIRAINGDEKLVRDSDRLR